MDKENNKFGRIGVLMGGISSERDVSLKSGNAIFQSLLKQHFEVIALDIIYENEQDISSSISNSKIDIAFIALHGKLGEDGIIQRILDKLDVPYVGSGSEASAIAFNKVLTQTLLKKNGLNVPAISL